MGILNKRALALLARYKYHGSDYTVIDNLLVPFHVYCTNLLPMWVAPNLITFVGFLLAVLPCFVLVFMCPRMDSDPPQWVLLVSGVGAFIYIHLDAMDGKQARRTGSSSPLGQLFDHGCDCFSGSVRALSGGMALGLPVWGVLAMVMSTNAMIFCSQLEEHQTGHFRTNNGVFGVTEGLLFDAFAHILFGIIGTQAARNVVFGVEIRYLVLGFAVVTEVGTSILGLIETLKTNHATISKDEIGDKKIGVKHTLFGMIPVLHLAVVTLLWCFAWGHHLFVAFPALLALTVALHWSVLSTRLLVAHMCKQPFNVFEIELFLVPITVAALNSNQHLLRLENETFIVVTLFIYVLATHLIYVTRIIQAVCKHLHISCFKIKPQVQQK